MWVVHQRLGELWFKYSNNELSNEEWEELELCMKANMEKCFKLARLYNLSYIAYTINDIDEQHRICAEIDLLKEKMYT